MAAARDVCLCHWQRLARSHAQLPLHQVESGDHLGDRVLDLQARVHLQEIELATVVQELDRPCALVCDRLRGRDGRGTHGPPRRVREPWRRRLLDHLLVASLQRAVTFVQVYGMAVRIGEHLDLDVPAALDKTLEQHAIIAERLGCLAPRARERLGKVRCGAHDPHALAAAASRRLDQQRETQPRCRRQQRRIGLVLVVVTGQHRHARRRHQAARLALRAHAIDRGRRRTDEHDARLRTGPRELRVFRQEAVARVDAVAAVFPCHREDFRAVQVALARSRRADADRRVGEARVQRVAIRLGKDGDRAQAQPPRGADDTAGDLAAIGNQDALQHCGPHILKMP